MEYSMLDVNNKEVYRHGEYVVNTGGAGIAVGESSDYILGATQKETPEGLVIRLARKALAKLPIGITRKDIPVEAGHINKMCVTVNHDVTRIVVSYVLITDNSAVGYAYYLTYIDNTWSEINLIYKSERTTAEDLKYFRATITSSGGYVTLVRPHLSNKLSLVKTNVVDVMSLTGRCWVSDNIETLVTDYIQLASVNANCGMLVTAGVVDNTMYIHTHRDVKGKWVVTDTQSHTLSTSVEVIDLAIDYTADNIAVSSTDNIVRCTVTDNNARNKVEITHDLIRGVAGLSIDMSYSGKYLVISNYLPDPTAVGNGVCGYIYRSQDGCYVSRGVCVDNTEDVILSRGVGVAMTGNGYHAWCSGPIGKQRNELVLAASSRFNT